ncbi:IclR family transcriptional regulator [Actinomadura madurae]|uniref:IclR family transcriptional regulator n=1 Tax=Actinomadura madurae TaxID=1993 RepID=UPI000D983C44|nr:IclR family transcriptional regulator [Actinomadura madurae]SPT49943.1 Transcriptional regulator kdgR [Actinomadura madurae]
MSRTGMDVESKVVREATGTAKALVKGLALVDLVAEAGPRRLTDLVEASGVPRGTVLRLLDVLCGSELLRTDAAGRYELGPRAAVWGQRFLDRLDVRERAEDLMRGLTERTRETCYLGVRQGLQVLYIAKSDSPQAVRPAAVVGSVNPLYSTGIGKALLAHADEDTVRAVLDGPLTARTPNTITDADALAAELAVTRRRGYAVDEIENEDGVRCVAVPVFDHTGTAVAALSVSAPAYRFPREDLPAIAELALEAVAELSARLGHRTAGHDTKEVS